MDYDTGRYVDASSGADISFVKIGSAVTIMGFVAVNEKLKAVPLLPYFPSRTAFFSVNGTFAENINVAGYGNGRVEPNRTAVDMWFNAAVTYARLNFTYLTDGTKTSYYPN